MHGRGRRVDFRPVSPDNTAMATDIAKLIANLFAFYDFAGKAVVSIGAGGGQFIEYGRQARTVYAVDNSAEALERLRESLRRSGLEDKFTLIHSDFFRCRQPADVAMFEFCLHEMPDPAAALAHARALAGDVLVLDHLPESPWAFYVTEEEKAAGGWRALRALAPRRVQAYEAVQFFKDFEELRLKVAPMGEEAFRRIEPFRGQTGFTIPMSYGFALV
jgi:tRNA A58 N-methylase Trm61